MKNVILIILGGILLLTSGCAMPRKGESVEAYIERSNNYGIGKIEKAWNDKVVTPAFNNVIIPVVKGTIEAAPEIAGAAVGVWAENEQYKLEQARERNAYRPTQVIEVIQSEPVHNNHYQQPANNWPVNCTATSAGSQVFVNCR